MRPLLVTVPPGPIVPQCPLGCGNVWNGIFEGSISSRKPSKWNVAYGQMSSPSIPEIIHMVFTHIFILFFLFLE